MDIQKLLAVLGPLAGPYQDEDLTEIMVDASDRVYAVRHGQIEDLAVRFDSPEALRSMIDDVLALAGKSVSGQHTTAGALRKGSG